jgi:hypothetical protein
MVSSATRPDVWLGPGPACPRLWSFDWNWISACAIVKASCRDGITAMGDYMTWWR